MKLLLKKLQNTSNQLKSYLVEGETIVFENIGEILLNKEGKINFEPSLSYQLFN